MVRRELNEKLLRAAEAAEPEPLLDLPERIDNDLFLGGGEALVTLSAK